MKLILNRTTAAIILVLAASAANATGGGTQPTGGDCAGNNSGNCNGPTASSVGTGMSESDARAAANALGQGGEAAVNFWASLSPEQRQNLMANQTFRGSMNLDNNQQLSSALSNYSPSSASAYGSGGEGGSAQARQALMVALSNNSSSRSSAAGGSGVGSVNVDGRVFYPGLPVPSPVISAANVINPTPTMSVVKTDCGGPADIIKIRDIESTRSTVFGLAAWGFPNGVEQALRAKSGAEGMLSYGPWSDIARDKAGNIVKARTVSGRIYIVYGYIVGGGASAGAGHNTTGSATALNGSTGYTSFGKSIDEYGCSFTETVTFYAPPPPPAPPAPPAPPVPQNYTIELTAQASAEVAKMPGVRRNPGGKRDPNVCYGLDNGVVIYANGQSCQKALDTYMATLPKPKAGAVATYVVKDAEGKVLATRKVEGTPGSPGAAKDTLSLPPSTKP